jgi:hypothetical protein
LLAVALQRCGTVFDSSQNLVRMCLKVPLKQKCSWVADAGPDAAAAGRSLCFEHLQMPRNGLLWSQQQQAQHTDI